MNNLYKILLLFFLAIFFINVSIAQNLNLNTKVSIKAQNKNFEEILNEISKKCGYYFSYSSKLINSKQKIDLNVTNCALSEVFKELFGRLSIDYNIIEKQIILKPSKKINTIKEPNKKFYTLNGYIKSKETGEVLIGSTISLKNNHTAVISNAYGFYSLTLEQGEYFFSFFLNGYKKQDLLINLNKSTQYNIFLEQEVKSQQIDSIKKHKKNDSIVFYEPIQKVKFSDTLLSKISVVLNPKELVSVPVFEKVNQINTDFSFSPDFIRALQSIPGILLHGDGSIFFFTRGGNKDQNLILVDEAPIYNPAHLFGFFSSIAPEVINDIKVYKSNIPVSYGERLSSVVDIKTKEGNLNQYSFFGNIGLFVSSISAEGPIKKDISSFSTTFRKSYIDWLAKKSNPDYTMSFYDIHGKVNFKFSNTNRLYFSCYYGVDDYAKSLQNSDNFGVVWNNIAGTLRWNHLYGAKLFSNLTLLSSKYSYNLYISEKLNRYINTSIANISLKYDFTWYLNPQNTLNFGIHSSNHYIDAGYVRTKNDKLTNNAYSRSANETVLYLGNEQNLSENWIISYGLRSILWQNFGNVVQYLYDNSFQIFDSIVNKSGVYYKKFEIEPRLNVQFKINQKSALKLSYNRIVQNLRLVSNSLSPFTTLEFWLPTGPNILPQISQTVSLGYFFHNQEKDFDFSIETYLRKMTNQIDYLKHVKVLLNSTIENELLYGNTKAYGIEFQLYKKIGNFIGRMAYTYSRAIKNFVYINGGNDFPSEFDRPHNLHLDLSYSNQNRFSVSLFWTFCTGLPFTSPAAFYYYNGYTIPVYYEKNNSRLPNYHRLDLSVNYRLNKNQNAKFVHSLNFTIYNLYARKNPIAINFNKIQIETGEYKVPFDFATENSLIPTSLSVLGFVPIITYSFRFK